MAKVKAKPVKDMDDKSSKHDKNEKKKAVKKKC